MPLAELMQEDVQLPEQREDASYDELQCRAMLLRVMQIARDRARLAHVAKAVSETYKDQIEALNGLETELRTQLQRYIELHNNGEKLVYPDVGTVYLQNKDAKPRPKLASPEAAISAYTAEEHPELWVLQFDAAKYAQQAKEHFEDTGELMPGMEATKPEPTLAVRAT